LAPFIGFGSIAMADNAVINAQIAQLQQELAQTEADLAEEEDLPLDEQDEDYIDALEFNITNLNDQIDDLRDQLIEDVTDGSSSGSGIINQQDNTDTSVCKQLQADMVSLDEQIEIESKKQNTIGEQYDALRDSSRYQRFKRKHQNDDLSTEQAAEFAQMEADLQALDTAWYAQGDVRANLVQERADKLEAYDARACIATFDSMKPVDAHIPTAQYPGRVFDGDGLIAGAEQVRGNIRGVSDSQDLPRLVIGWVKFALEFLIVVAVIAIIYGGILMITDFGDGGRKEQGQKIIQYVIIGLIVIMASYAIVNTVITQQLDL